MMETAGRGLRGRFTGLTVVLVILSVSGAAIGEGRAHNLIGAVAMATLLLFAIQTASRGFRVAALTLAVPASLGQLTLHLKHSLIPPSLVFAFFTAFLALLTTAIVFTVLRSEVMDTDTLIGGVCAYFILGVTWGSAYALIELMSPGSFAVSPGLAAAGNWHIPTHPITPLMQYFSFVTLTTVGYGDMSPLTHMARLVSMLEALTGQLYLAVLVGRLVGLHIAQAR
jgi:hypothetical protein